jgi:hypothetical protein
MDDQNNGGDNDRNASFSVKSQGNYSTQEKLQTLIKPG